MPRDHITQVIARHDYGTDAFRLDLQAPELARDLQPGQFLQVRIGSASHDPLLRRPFGYLCRDRAAGRVSLLVRSVGRGTAMLREARPGDTLAILGPLGHGFGMTTRGPALLAAGGIGLVPLYDLAVTLAPRVPLTLVYGARNAGELHESASLRDLPLTLVLVTDDGSEGRRGTVLTALAGLNLAEFTFYYGCGPRLMLAGLQTLMTAAGVPGELSLEERMACGYGVCLGCAVAVAGENGGLAYQRACLDGPVFPAGEVVFGDRA